MTTLTGTSTARVDDLRPFPGNARRGDVDMIKESLRTLGQYRPIVVNQRDNVILAGNHTWQAAKALGWSEIAVSFVDVDDQAARKINLIDNRSNDIATYDDAQLVALLKEVEDLAGTGFTDADLRKLIGPVPRNTEDLLKPFTAPGMGSAEVIRADARNMPLPDDSVDLVITSPPYFALRSYQDDGEHYTGQIGDEKTPDDYVSSLLEVVRECVRVLKPSGSLWVNLGDKYAGQGSGYSPEAPSNQNNPFRADGKKRQANVRSSQTYGLKPKSLIGLPWRFALRCIDELGLVLRAEVIWHKPNAVPESVRDRVRRDHEQWFHFTLHPDYYSAVDEIRDPYLDKWPDRKPETERKVPGRPERENRGYMIESPQHTKRQPNEPNPLGRIPGSVWTINTEGFRAPDELGVDHYAAFPPSMPRKIIKGWSPIGVCTACGEGRRPILYRATTGIDNNPRQALGVHGFSNSDWTSIKDNDPDRIVGHGCACAEATAPTEPAVILDPFGGTGTVATVAKALGRRGISVDMSADYCKIATWRTNDPKELERAKGDQ
jgi:DNA modification methylase